MAEFTPSRRDVVCATGIAGITLLAGCTSGDTASTDGAEEGGDSGSGEPTYLSDEPAYDGWLDDVSNYEGTLDLTGQESVSVTVGYELLSFDPPAVAVSPGTTVTWEWTGEGGFHNVVSEGEGPLESELVDEAGHTYEYSFQEAGTYRYKCNPHEANGMKGAVYVV